MPVINKSNGRLNDNDVFKLYVEYWLTKLNKIQEEILKKEVIVERVAHLDVVTLYSFLLSVSSNPYFKF
jgi:hypothetical protein